MLKSIIFHYCFSFPRKTRQKINKNAIIAKSVLELLMLLSGNCKNIHQSVIY